ncbi:hypothetical protein [Metaclostridioides mangenotii]|nr:hypothetical protein [Clostridioides mangenotii]
MNCKDFDIFRELCEEKVFEWDYKDFYWFKRAFKRLKQIEINFTY